MLDIVKFVLSITLFNPVLTLLFTLNTYGHRIRLVVF